MSEKIGRNVLWFAGFLFGLILTVEVIIKNIPKDFSGSNRKSEVKVPHPMELFIYTCNSKRECKQTAQTYLVNIDGMYIIPEENFVVRCLRDKKAHQYCKSMIRIGQESSIQFDSEEIMRSYISNSKNPEFDSSFRNHFGKGRFERAKSKLSI